MEAVARNSEPDMPLVPGDRVARFEIVRQIGVGGSADVYEAEHLDLGRRVALKIVRVHDEGSAEETLARFRREARTAGGLKHARIADVYDVGHTEAGDPYLVMELLDGETLDVVAARGSMPVPAAIEIVRELADALAYVHARDIVHRDVKPHNLVLHHDEPGVLGVKLVDFGISKPRSAERERTITRAGSLVGTPHYMPPEAFIGGETLPAQDVYASGIVLYECLTGRPPYDAQSVAGVIAAVMRTDAPPVQSLRPDCPDVLAAIVAKAIARDLSDRFVSADALRDALDAATRELGLPVGPAALAMLHEPARESGVRARPRTGATTVAQADTEAAFPRARRGRRFQIAAACAAALVAIAGGGMAAAAARSWLAPEPVTHVEKTPAVAEVASQIATHAAAPAPATPRIAAPPLRASLADRDAARALAGDALDASTHSEWQHAEGLYRASLRLDASNPDAWLGLGNVETHLRHPADARRAYRRFLALAPANDANAYTVRSILAHEAPP